MNTDEAVASMIRSLNSNNIRYMATGSLVSNLYGVPRSTKDADFVVEAAAEEILPMLNALPRPLRVDPQMSFETVTVTTRHIVELVGAPFKIELFYLSKDAHDQERFQRRRQGTLFGELVWLPTAEDVIITKLRWSKQGRRTKDADDVRNVLAVQGDGLDLEYLHRWCDLHDTRDLLEEIRRSIPPI